MTFGHIALRIKNLDVMLDFYCRELGLVEAFRIYNDDRTVRIVYLRLSHGQYVELCLGGTEERIVDDLTTIGFRHICFLVQEIEEEKKNLEHRGVVFDSKIISGKDGTRSCYLKDPEGNRIELMEITDNSLQRQFEMKNVIDK